jgi:hypothetical protein
MIKITNYLLVVFSGFLSLVTVIAIIDSFLFLLNISTILDWNLNKAIVFCGLWFLFLLSIYTFYVSTK